MYYRLLCGFVCFFYCIDDWRKARLVGMTLLIGFISGAVLGCILGALVTYVICEEDKEKDE